MTSSFASSSKAQMKIQQMAFMLVALMIFFALVGVVYFAISGSNLKQKAQDLEDKEAKEIVRKLSGSPELSFTSSTDCSSCIDIDKALFIKEIPIYKEFWNLDYLMIEKFSSSATERECTRANYPDCTTITIIEKDDDIATQTAFVSLARWDEELSSGSFRYEIGRIHASGAIQKER